MLRPGSRIVRALEYLGLASPDPAPATRRDLARGALLGLVPVLAAVVVTTVLNVHGWSNFVVWVGVAMVTVVVWWSLLLWIWRPSGRR
jgi:hypothetical protein